MLSRPKIAVCAFVVGLASCGGAEPHVGEGAAADTVATAEPAGACIPPGGPVITGAAVGEVRIRAGAEDVRRECDVVGDTTLVLEGQSQPALRIALGGDTVVAEVVNERIWRMRVVSPGLLTTDSLGVGTPVRRLADLPGATLASGEGDYFIISPTHCGLSFGIEGLPFRGRGWTVEELATMPDSVRVGTVLVIGACHADGGLRILWDTVHAHPSAGNRGRE